MASYKKKEYSKSTENAGNLQTLNELFGNILHIDIIESVARSQQWNLQKTCSILTEMSSNVAPVEEKFTKKKQKSSPLINTVAYCGTEDDDTDVVIESENGGNTSDNRNHLYPKNNTLKTIYPTKTVNVSKGATKKKSPGKSKRELDFDRACLKILSGNRIMVILRGLPGSGKSHMARHLVASTVAEDHRTLVFSTDDYFVSRGIYNFNPVLLQEAHTWNQRRVWEAAQMGMSPIIIDNTNTQAWEIRPYVMTGVQFGYQIEILEPDTPWYFNVPELTRRNMHGVPKHKIFEMCQRYEKNITVERLFAMYNIVYPTNRQPPQARLYPPVRKIMPRFEPTAPKDILIPVEKKKKLRKRQKKTETEIIEKSKSEDRISANSSTVEQLSDTAWESDNDGTWEELRASNSSDSVRDLLTSDVPETMEYVLVNSDNTFVYQKEHEILSPIVQEKKPQDDLIKFTDSEESPQEISNNSADLIHFADEKTISNELPDVQQSEIEAGFEALSIETSNKTPENKKSFSFPKLNFGSLDLNQTWQSLFKTDKKANVDLNVRYSSELISQMISREAGTNTSSLDFLSLVKNDVNPNMKVLHGSVRSISEKCAPKKPLPPPKVLLLDKGTMTGIENFLEVKTDCGNKSQHLSTLLALFPHVQDDVLQDILEKCQGDVNWAVDLLLENNSELTIPSIESNTTNEITQNVINDIAKEDCACISENEVEPFNASVPHVGTLPHVVISPGAVPKIIKVKNMSFVDDPLKKHIEEQFKISDEHYSDYLLKLRRKRHGELVPVAPEQDPIIDYTEEQTVIENDSDLDSEEETIELNFGLGLIEQLEKQFGNPEIKYPSGFQPVIQLPATLAKQLHALWLESVYSQMQNQCSVLDEMERQDKELARQLQQRETNMSDTRPPKIPDLQEIMDMEIALAVYRADQQQWRKETPDDLASRMTRQKLYEAFPDLDKDVLVEILQAHGNSFEKTAEALMCSIGRQQTETLVNVDGRIMSKTTGEELDKQRKLLEQVREQEKDYDKDEPDKQTANYYREQAAHHLEMRQQLFNKAQQSIQKGMPQVAGYYSEVARLHMQKYEIANSRAACAFLSEHTLNHGDSQTIDLHYLYVREAEQALAMFLDGQISRLQQIGKQREILFIITGRGIHSAGGRSQIKPAIKRKLKERKLGYSEMNPGLLKVIVTKHSILTNDLKNN